MIVNALVGYNRELLEFKFDDAIVAFLQHLSLEECKSAQVFKIRYDDNLNKIVIDEMTGLEFLKKKDEEEV